MIEKLMYILNGCITWLVFALITYHPDYPSDFNNDLVYLGEL